MKVAVFTVSTPEYTPAEVLDVLSDWALTASSGGHRSGRSADGNPGFWAGNRCTWPLATFERDAPRIKAMTEAAGLAMPGLGTYPTGRPRRCREGDEGRGCPWRLPDWINVPNPMERHRISSCATAPSVSTATWLPWRDSSAFAPWSKSTTPSCSRAQARPPLARPSILRRGRHSRRGQHGLRRP